MYSRRLWTVSSSASDNLSCRPAKSSAATGPWFRSAQRALILLEALLRANGQVVTKAEILERVWPGVDRRGRQHHGPDRCAAQGARRPRTWRRVDRHRAAHRLSPARPTRPPLPPAPSAESGKPTIAILPFVNLSGDTTRDYFADGIVEDLITALSRFKSFAVVSRYSTFAYKGRAADVRAGRARACGALSARRQRAALGRARPRHGATRRCRQRHAHMGDQL